MGPGYEEYDLTKVRLVLCPLHPVPVVRHRRSTTTSQLKACSHAATDLNGTCSEHLRNCELPVDSFRFGCLQISARCLHLIVPSNNESHQLLGKRGIYLPFHVVAITCILKKLFCFPLSFEVCTIVCVFVFHIMCRVSLIPVLMQCSRLMSNSKNLLTYILNSVQWYHGDVNMP